MTTCVVSPLALPPNTQQSAVLREAVEDLEWAAAPVTVELQREPPCLTFVARSDVAGDVKVRRIPACEHLPLLHLTRIPPCRWPWTLASPHPRCSPSNAWETDRAAGVLPACCSCITTF